MYPRYKRRVCQECGIVADCRCWGTTTGKGIWACVKCYEHMREQYPDRSPAWHSIPHPSLDDVLTSPDTLF